MLTEALLIATLAGVGVLVIKAYGKSSNAPAPSTSTLTSTLTSTSRSDGLDQGTADNWEDNFYEVARRLPVRASLAFTYVDGKGQRTQRVLDVRQFGDLGDRTLILGHCHLRDQTRCFRADRISECHDNETGKVIADVAAHLHSLYASSPEACVERVLVEKADLLEAIFHVGKADGRMMAAERRVFEAVFFDLASDPRVTVEMVEKARKGLRQLSLNQFKLAVGRIAKSAPEDLRILFNAAEEMIGTEKTVGGAEREAVEYIRKKAQSSTAAPGGQ